MRTGWQPKAAPSFAAGTFSTVVRRRRLAAVLVLLFVMASWLIFSSATLLTSSPTQYVLVIDAGSSGTRMNAFKWHDAATSGGLPLLQAISPDAAPHKVPRRALETRRAYKRVETEPGMDKFAENVGKLGQTALEPLLEWSRAVIPRNSWPTTPVFLLGTAGLRKLNEEHRERVMNEARSVLKRCGFRFRSSWARVLGGNDEGVYAWVALNAAEGKLGTENTLGALDLGGSSLQVTFAIDNAETVDKNSGGASIRQSAEALPHAPFAVNVSLLGTHHTLYTHSHYHFGLDDAFERSPDATVCSRLAEKVVTLPTECDAPPCALGTPQPHVAGKFIALAGFYVVSHFFNLGANAGVAAVAKAGTDFCPLTWSEVQSRHPGEMAVETYCFRTAYIAALVPQGLGLKEDQVEIGQGTAGWTLGAALVEGHHHAGLGVGVKGTATAAAAAAGGGGSQHSATGGAFTMSAVSQWAGLLLPSWGGRAAAGVLAILILAVLILAALVLAYKRGHDPVARVLRAQGWLQSRRRSSNGILSAADFGSEDLGDNTGHGGGGGGGGGFQSSIFFRLFGAAAKGTNGKKGSPSSIWQEQQPGMSSSENGLSAAASGSYGSPDGMVAVGSARALGLTRSATYSRRLSALESASSERGG
ncbi:hypothetical protein Ndes2526A_g02251 [Nannochloris sp. 'desiccata']